MVAGRCLKWYTLQHYFATHGMSTNSLVIHAAIPGDYQQRALRRGRRLQRAWHRLRQRAAAAVVGLPRGAALLDAGCGSGIMLRYLARPGMRVTGIDISPPAAAFARAHLADLAPDIILHNVPSAPIAPASHDIALCCEVLEHLTPAEADALLLALQRALRPGGQLYITVPNARSPWLLLEWLLDTLRLTPPMRGQQHVTRYHRGSLAARITQAGFTVERLGTFNLLAPFGYWLHPRLGRRLLLWELAHCAHGGNLLYLLARKPQ
jgi:2-polyprenyl-3-methyl-5-hydroxy-6-metoxy-1,4-benzoquinol methylase